MKKHLTMNHWLAVGVYLLCTATSAQALPSPSFNIDLSFSGLNATQVSYFNEAADFWESVITGYAPSVTGSYINGVTISASGSYIDGVYGVLGSAGPQTGWSGATGGYLLAKTGQMNFDLADIDYMIDNGTFTSVIKHEMAHVLGFGTLWTYNGLYNVNNPGQYTGQYGLAAYKDEFNQPLATYIPVEQGGGEGTAGGHWNEADGGNQNSGITDDQGRDMKYELMTGWLNLPAASLFVSNTTIQSFRDLGYSVVNLATSAQAVPLPTNFWMFASALLSLLGINGKIRKNTLS